MREYSFDRKADNKGGAHRNRQQSDNRQSRYSHKNRYQRNHERNNRVGNGINERFEASGRKNRSGKRPETESAGNQLPQVN